MDWYAIFVKTGKEDLVRRMFQKHFDESVVRAIVPRRKLLEKKQGQTYEVYKKLFPGYVLLNTQINSKSYYEFKRIPINYRLLNKYSCKDNIQNYKENDGDLETYSFSKIDDEEIALILQLIGDSETIESSTIYVENTIVTVCDGPLKGKEGIIKKIDRRKKRARIELDFNGEKMRFDVGIQVLGAFENVEKSE
ncbi:MAG: antiterminator LoaP [Bacillota bacterium]